MQNTDLQHFSRVLPALQVLSFILGSVLMVGSCFYAFAQLFYMSLS